MSTIPIAVQLYSVRHEAEADLPATLARIKAMGYEGVEFAGWYGHDAPSIRHMLDAAGLRCAGAHVGIDTLRGGRIEESIAFALEIGNPYLIVPWLPAETIDEWKAAAEELNAISLRLAPRGLRTGYHNHDKEFRPSASGELPWDAFFGTADPSVIMQFDTGNALSGGGEALPFLARYPGRATTVHLKEYDPATKSFAPPIGQGGVPFAEIFAECESSGGTQWYIVEYEDPALAPFDGIEQCLAGLRSLGK
ncbi:MAG: sugar phosphate isomerase/epimerase family protein [Armatimonadota bacterium]